MERNMTSTPLTEKSNSNTQDIDLMNGYEIAKTINNEDKKVAQAIEKVLPQIGEAIELIAAAFRKGGRLAYFGAGTSGRLGVLDASECYPTFGVDKGMVQAFIAGGKKALSHSVENAEDKKELGLKDLEAFAPSPSDIIVSISASGNANYIIAVLEQAQKLGCKTIAISSNPEAKIKQVSDIFINPIVGEEAITGSSRMKSGTAQKMILNMLSTGAMIRIGKTYHNYMIDLQLLSQKLYQRGCRFVSEIAHISEQEAAQYLEASKHEVKTACIMAAKKISYQEAHLLLEQNEGILRKILK